MLEYVEQFSHFIAIYFIRLPSSNQVVGTSMSCVAIMSKYLKVTKECSQQHCYYRGKTSCVRVTFLLFFEG